MRARGLALLAACVATPALGWQNDVHFGLTEWVARAAGFSDADATQVAYATQAPDDYDGMDAVSLTIHEILFSLDPQGAEGASWIIHDLHFPALGKPGVPAAQRPVDFPAAVPLADAASASEFRKLGRALHALEDSYSHSGTPDIPVPFWRPLWQWAHPESRGAWFRTRADHTWCWTQHPSAAQIAMQQVHAVLKKSPLPRGTPANFPADRVQRCVDARTRDTKRECYPHPEAHDPHGVPYIEQISVDHPVVSKIYSARSYVSRLPILDVAASADGVEAELVKRVLEWANLWLVKRQLKEAAAFFSPSASIASTDGEIGPEAFLRQGLTRDEGEDDAAAVMQEAWKPLEFTNLSQAIRGFQGKTLDIYDISRLDSQPARYAFAFRFIHKPYVGAIFYVDGAKGDYHVVKVIPITG